MKEKENYNYEEFMINIDEVLNLIIEAIENRGPLSLGRYGHGEIAFIGESDFPEWKIGFAPHDSYAGATVSIKTIKHDLLRALETTDIVGLHSSWSEAWEDLEAAKMTKLLLNQYSFKPRWICPAFITHEMIKRDEFWRILKNCKVALVGRRAAEAVPVFREKGINIVYTSELEGYEEMDRVYDDMSKRRDWDIALLSAGIPATILVPRLAQQANKVAIDFGHALDKLVDGEDFNYEKILRDWTEGMNKRMLVSIVMAVYNGEEFLKEALDSALDQTHTNIEMIVVNDGSTDGTKKILDNIDDTRVRIIHLEKNQGAANALNVGISQARGKWIAIQDADDNSYPTRIEEQVKYIVKHPELAGVGTFIECIGGGLGVSGGMLRGVEKNRNSFISREEIKENIYWGCPLTHSSVMFSKDIFQKVGGYNTEFKIAYDYDLWLRMLENGAIENVPKVLLQYRIHKKSLSHRDSVTTVNEIQIASSRGIYRRFNKGQQCQSKVIVMGPKDSCKNYTEYIAPASGLIVKDSIYKDYYTKLPHVLNGIKARKIDAVILLGGDNKEKVLQYLQRKGLKLNEKVFNIYNFEK